MKLQYKKEDEWIDCFHLEPTPNLPLKMPNTAYLGFSAETGELSDNFDLISLETRNLYQAVGSKVGSTGATDRGSRRGGKGRKAKTGGSWGWFFFKVIMFFMVIGGGYVGYTWYRANKRSSRF